MNKTIFIFLSVCIYTINAYKIIGLIAVKNEQSSIEQCIKALSLYTDEIVILDDVSQDNTPTILQNIQNIYQLHIITKDVWSRDEAKDRNTLLVYGRKLGGTHFIIIDADEMLTAQCIHDDFLKNTLYALQPGEWISCTLIDLYNNAQQCLAQKPIKGFAFCDNGTALFDEECRVHSKRIPEGINGRQHILEPREKYGLLHFKCVNWNNVLLRNAWYQCLITIMWPNVPRSVIGTFYAKKIEEQTSTLKNVDPKWFDYPFFNLDDFTQPDHWRKQQILDWFEEYGTEYFKDLTIWHLDFADYRPSS